MNSITEFLEAVTAREKRTVDLTSSAGDIAMLLKLVRKYREALERVRQKTGDAGYDGGDSGVQFVVCDALNYDPRNELQNPAPGSG